MNTKHTSGPWVSGCGFIRAPGEHGNDKLVCRIRRNLKESAANGALLAAAPELLAALEVALLWMVCKVEPVVSGTGDPYDAFKRDEAQIRSAIAKATGAVCA